MLALLLVQSDSPRYFKTMPNILHVKIIIIVNIDYFDWEMNVLRTVLL